MKCADTDIIILCGGLGTRLRSTIGESQKTMAIVGEEPFLNIVLRYLKAQGFRRVILAAGYQAQQVEQYYRQNDLGLTIEFSREEIPLGTGGAVKNAQHLVRSNPCFVVNGDCFSTLAYDVFLKFHIERDALATLSVVKMDDCRDYGTIVFGQDGVIQGFEEKKDIDGGGLINVGAYCFDKEILNMLPAGKFSLEREFFPLLPQKIGGRFCGIIVETDFLDIGTPDRYAKAEQMLRKVSGQ